MAKKVIIYGAGRRAPIAYDECVRGGYETVAFCDSDSSKAGDIICGLPVMTRTQILKKFNDFFVYIAPSAPINEEIERSIVEDGFALPERIINRSKTRTYVSCSSLEKVAIVTNEGIYACCSLDNIRNAAPYVEWKDSIEATVDAFIEQRDKYINELNTTDAVNPCTGCPALYKGQWETDRKISVLALSPSYPCQLKCEYCELQSNGKYITTNQSEIEKANNIDVAKLVDCFEKKGKFIPSEPIQLSGGEITVSRKKDELLDAVEKYPLQIFTNAIIYDDRVAKLAARTDGSYLNISLDAGTRSTYAKVKGLDVWDRVVDTLSKYKETGSRMLLKYIILPDNCNCEDFDGFLKIADEISPLEVYISCDISVDVKNHPREVTSGAVYLAKGCKTLGIQYTILPYFGEENMKWINENIR